MGAAVALRHPDPMPAAVAGGPGVILIDDPLADPLQLGERLLGWEGDDRLALYLNVPRRFWELWRLEDDGVYRRVARRDAGDGQVGMRAHEVIASLLFFLVSHDRRRGHDPLAQVAATNRAVDQAADRARADLYTNELNPKLAWAARRDGLLDHATGVTSRDMADRQRHLETIEANRAEQQDREG